MLTNMTLTPPAGGYIAMFSSSVVYNSTTSAGTVAIFVGGTVVPHSSRPLARTGAQGMTNMSVYTQAWVEVAGATAIDVRATTSAGSISYIEKSLYLVSATGV